MLYMRVPETAECPQVFILKFYRIFEPSSSLSIRRYVPTYTKVFVGVHVFQKLPN